MLKSMAHTVAVVATASLVVISACAPPPPAGLSAADRAAIEQAAVDWETNANAGDWAAVAALYAEDATVLPPNQPATSGRASVQESFEAMPAGAQISLEIVRVDGVGDLAYTYGTYNMTVTMGEETTTDVGKYIEVRHRQADGSWPIIFDIWNSDAPLPGMEPEM